MAPAGRTTFTPDELTRIRAILAEMSAGDAHERGRLRGLLRAEFQFFVSDFLGPGSTALTPEGLDDLVSRELIRIGEPAAETLTGRTDAGGSDPTVRRKPAGGANVSEGDPMDDPAEVRAYYDATTDRMREMLDHLARHPGRRFTNPEIEDALGWEPLSVRGTQAASTRRLGRDAFQGRGPYHWIDGGPRSHSGRFEMWMDARQSAAIRGSR